MKKIFIFIAACSLLILSGCQGVTSKKTLETYGLLVDLNEEEISVDIVEYINRENTQRINELNLDSLLDMPDGYYIHNPDTTPTTYSLTENTEYCFFDWKEQFSDKYEGRNINTNNVNDFIKYIESYDNATPGMPFVFEIKDNKVLKITEIIMP